MLARQCAASVNSEPDHLPADDGGPTTSESPRDASTPAPSPVDDSSSANSESARPDSSPSPVGDTNSTNSEAPQLALARTHVAPDFHAHTVQELNALIAVAGIPELDLGTSDWGIDLVLGDDSGKVEKEENGEGASAFTQEQTLNIKYLMKFDDLRYSLPDKLSKDVLLKYPIATSGFPKDSFFYYSIDGSFKDPEIIPGDPRAPKIWSHLLVIVDRKDQIAGIELSDESGKNADALAEKNDHYYVYDFVRNGVKSMSAWSVRHQVFSSGKNEGFKIYSSLYDGDLHVKKCSMLFLPQPVINTLLLESASDHERRVLQQSQATTGVVYFAYDNSGGIPVNVECYDGMQLKEAIQKFCQATLKKSHVPGYVPVFGKIIPYDPHYEDYSVKVFRNHKTLELSLDKVLLRATPNVTVLPNDWIEIHLDSIRR